MTLVEEIESTSVRAGAAVWFLGGASLAIRSPASLIYLDLFTGPPSPGGLTKAIPDVIDLDAISRADLALVTHQHGDHCHRPSLAKLYQDTTCLFLGSATCNHMFWDWGIPPERTRVIAPEESWSRGGTTIHALPARDAFEIDALTFVIEGGGVRIFDGGDTLYFPEMEEIGRRWALDVAFLSYATNPPGETYYLTEEMVLAAARSLSARILILKHYDLWQEFSADPAPLVDRLRAEGHDARTLRLGERLQLDKT
jgi:L-ascorbate 6-phosphate lactonase